ncbi:MAG: DegT/DnrJ/EryC1/StrS aminotransferase family protein [Geobacteraceae bacterium]|nr:DegT/DnrJ/EryC1/StrS aminotransferase family protein [Geobacteraceae bacterium]
MKIPLGVPSIGPEEMEAVQRVLESGWLTEGVPNSEFEQQFAAYVGVSRAVSLNSCTSALQLALQAQSISGEVILPSFTFAASANAVVTAGATPVFADIDYATCTVDPDDIERKITPATEAIMVVHYAGQCCRMDRIMSLARRYGLQVIEDSAETIGATFNGKGAGSFAVGCFSFFPTKNITTGEGGMLTTDDDDLADTVRTLAGHGIRKNTLNRETAAVPWQREVSLPGYNYRMSAILAAIGVEQMKKIDDFNRRRIDNAQYLAKRIDCPGIDLPVTMPGCSHVYQMFTIKVKTVDRDAFVRGMRARGVMASVHFTPPVHRQGYYARNFPVAPGALPITESVAATIATLPLYPGLTQPELDYIAESVAAVMRELERRD